MTIKQQGGVFGRNPAFNDVSAALMSTTALSAIGGPIELDGNFPVGTENVALGASALQSASLSGGYNVALGVNALGSLTSGQNNVAIGRWAMRAATTSTDSLAIGRSALELNSGGTRNVAVGFYAGRAGGAASQNVSVGWQALTANANGTRNVAVGDLALGVMNPASAVNSYNIGIGYLGGYGITTGVNNTVIGHNAGTALTTGSNNILLGYDAEPSSPTVSNETTIGNSSTTKSRIFGDIVLQSGNGIDFSATSGTGTSELFDDYEEGTWTPTFQNYDGTPTVNAATYVKIGELVTAFFMVTFDGTADGSQVSIFTGSLPFAIASDNSLSSQITFASPSGAGNKPVRAERAFSTSILVMNADEGAVTYSTLGTGQLGMVFTYRA